MFTGILIGRDMFCYCEYFNIDDTDGLLAQFVGMKGEPATDIFRIISLLIP